MRTSLLFKLRQESDKNLLNLQISQAHTDTRLTRPRMSAMSLESEIIISHEKIKILKERCFPACLVIIFHFQYIYQVGCWNVGIRQ